MQQVLEEGISRIAREPVRVVCAGRTDSGVHALGQVVHFDTTARRPERAWWMGVDTYLPPDISIIGARPVPGSFHARFSALARTYRYVILNRPARPGLLRGRVTWVHRPLDVDAMAEGGRFLVGEHDFSGYRASACQARHAVRTVHELTVARKGDRIEVRVRANAFLHHMVRNIVGVLLAIGRGEKRPRWALEVLLGRERAAGGVTAPPDGLYLARVEYPEHYRIPPVLSDQPL